MAQSRLNRKYALKFAAPQRYRRMLQFHQLDEASLPASVDLRSQFTACYDQLDVGSCVDNATCAVVEHLMITTQYKWQFRPSRLFSYWNARSIEGSTSQDAGSTIADGVAAIHQYGVCPESESDGTNPDWLWPYGDAASGLYLQKPNDACYKDAVLHASLNDAQVDLTRSSVLNLLAQGMPIIFGFVVHQSFENQEVLDTGIMKVPGFLDQQLGGHGQVCVGYLLNTSMGNQGVKDWALIRNSWGTTLYNQNPVTPNLAGCYYMPLDQVLCNPHQASDAHVIYSVGYSKPTA